MGFFNIHQMNFQFDFTERVTHQNVLYDYWAKLEAACPYICNFGHSRISLGLLVTTTCL